MRKTSHDGTDATSITSGIEIELKKAGTNISKIKKSSIKRKVQNYSHESDDGIIEPLLQIDKEKSEIANRSAKYLLNKSKTDSYERGNKSSENFAEKKSISTPVSSTSKIITNIENDNQISTSYIYGTASIHNHMNTNVFGMYDVSQGTITTKNPILVEIDVSKPGGYNPGPLIFTTAKIHTDSKTKFMEPVHVTPMPILSTIEGSVVKTVANNAEIPLMKNISGKSDAVPPIKSELIVSTTLNTVSSNVEMLFSKSTSYSDECQLKNKKEAQPIDFHTDPIAIYSTNQNLSQLSTGSTLPTTAPSVNINSKTKNDEVRAASQTIGNKNKDSKPINTQTTAVVPKSAANVTSLAQKLVTPDKTKGVIYVGESKDLSTIVQLPPEFQKTDIKSINTKSSNAPPDNRMGIVTLASKVSPDFSDIQNQESKSKISKLTEFCDPKDNATQSKVSYGSSKKLQRQKNASIEDTDTNNINVLTKDKIEKESLEKKENTTLKTIDSKIDKGVTSISCATIIMPTSNPIVTTASISQSTSKIKSPTDTSNLIPTTSSGSEYVSKAQSNSYISHISKDKATSIATSVSNDQKYSGNIPAMATFSNVDSAPSTSKSPKSEFVVKCESSTTTILPSYIVSTSKTKIGSTLTSNTITSITKAQLQKPSSQAVYNPNETAKVTTASPQSDRPTVGTSTSNGTQHTIFSQQAKSNANTFKKDGRA